MTDCAYDEDLSDGFLKDGFEASKVCVRARTWVILHWSGRGEVVGVRQ